MDALVHVTPVSAPPLLLPLLLPLSMTVLPVSSGLPPSGGGLELPPLELLHATASPTAAAPETAHKIIPFFILKRASSVLAQRKLPASGPTRLSHDCLHGPAVGRSSL